MNVLFTRLPAAVVLVSLLAACAVGPDYQQPQLNVPEAFKQAPAGGAMWQPAQVKAADGSPWWTAYGDAELNGLMDKLNRQSLSIAQAEAQYRSAAAASVVTMASVWPEP